MRLSEKGMDFGKRLVYKSGPQLLTLSVILSKLLGPHSTLVFLSVK